MLDDAHVLDQSIARETLALGQYLILFGRTQVEFFELLG